jgi:7-keto-8-aminopelargonate synthetase-like enzyme
MGTLGKALGSTGAYICGTAALRDYLVNRARSFIFSTAPPPLCAAASRAAVELLESAEGESLVNRLHQNIALFASLLPVSSQSAIFPFILGNEDAAVAASQALLTAGFLVPAIRYPTVARGSARLRVTITARHGRGPIEDLASRLVALRSGAGAPLASGA